MSAHADRAAADVLSRMREDAAAWAPGTKHLKGEHDQSSHGSWARGILTRLKETADASDPRIPFEGFDVEMAVGIPMADRDVSARALAAQTERLGPVWAPAADGSGMALNPERDERVAKGFVPVPFGLLPEFRERVRHNQTVVSRHGVEKYLNVLEEDYPDPPLMAWDEETDTYIIDDGYHRAVALVAGGISLFEVLVPRESPWGQAMHGEAKHAGPGPHSTGTPQTVHGGGAAEVMMALRARAVVLIESLLASAEADALETLLIPKDFRERMELVLPHASKAQLTAFVDGDPQGWFAADAFLMEVESALKDEEYGVVEFLDAPKPVWVAPVDPDAPYLDGQQDFMREVLLPFRPESEPTTLDVSALIDVVENPDHPNRIVAARAYAALLMLREDPALGGGPATFEAALRPARRLIEYAEDGPPPTSYEYNNVIWGSAEVARAVVNLTPEDVLALPHAGERELTLTPPPVKVDGEEADLLVNDGAFAVTLKKGVAKMHAPAITTKEALHLLEVYGYRTEDAKAAALMGNMLEDPEDDDGLGIRDRVHFHALAAMVHAWAQSSNDQHAPSLWAQEAAKETFDLHQTKAWDSDPSTHYRWHTNKALPADEVARFKTAQAKVLQSMYAATQEHFAKQGVTHLRVHRGQHEWFGSERPMASWSASHSIAESFSSGRRAQVEQDARVPNGPVIRSKVVPVEQILCTPATGYGCLSEEEVVLLAQVPGAMSDSDEFKHLPGQHDQMAHGRRGPRLGPPQTVEEAVEAMLALKKSGKGNPVLALVGAPLTREERMLALDEVVKRSRTTEQVAAEDAVRARNAVAKEEADRNWALVLEWRALFDRDADARDEDGEPLTQEVTDLPKSLLYNGRDVADGEDFLTDHLTTVVRSPEGIEGVRFAEDDAGTRATVRRGPGALDEYAAHVFGKEMGFEGILGRSFFRGTFRRIGDEVQTQDEAGAGTFTHVREYEEGDTVAVLGGYNWDWSGVPDEQVAMMTQFDYLVGHRDRHLNNVVIREDGSLLAIDNSMVWGSWHQMSHHDAEHLKTIDWDRAERALEAATPFLRLTPFGRGEQRIKHVRERIAAGRQKYGQENAT